MTLTRKELLANHMEIRVVCKCPVPNFFTTKTETFTTGKWWWKKEHTEEIRVCSQKEDVRFVCPRCSTVWFFSASRGESVEGWPEFPGPGHLYSPWATDDDKRTSWKKVPINP